MKSLFCLLAFLCAFSSVGQSSKYFRKAYQTVYGNYVGVYPLEEKDTLEVNHLRFNYSKYGELITIESCKAYTGERVFSDFLNSHKIGFEYSDSSFTIRDYYVSWDGSLVQSDETVEYILDAKGRTIRSIEMNYDEELITRYVGTVKYTYKGDQLVSIEPEGDFPFNNLYQNARQLELKLNKNGLITDEIIHFKDELAYEGGLTDEHNAYDYDANGNFISRKSYDAEGNLIISFDQCAYTKHSYDKNGYLSGLVLFDVDNKRTNYAVTEYIDEDVYETFIYPCETIMVNDNYGNTLSTRYFMDNGQAGVDRFDVHEIKSEYDYATGSVTTTNYNSKGELISGGSGYAGKFIQQDKLGRTIKEYTFDTERKAIRNVDGTYIVCAAYEGENTITMTYFDQENKPLEDNSGAHKYVYSRDEYGYDIYQVYALNDVYLGQEQLSDSYDGLNARVLYQEDGYTLVSISYFAYDDKTPTLCPGWYFRKTFAYDENGILEKISFLDTDLKLTNAVFGDVSYAEIRYKFNEDQYEIESAYYDEEGNRTIDEGMISIYRTSYNANGLVSQIDRYAADGNLLNKSMNYATVKYVYNSDGLIIEEAYFNEKGERWSDVSGIASYLSEYKNGQLIKSQWRNSEYKPIVNFDGVYQVVNSYSENGNLLETRYLNKKGKKMNSVQGAHRIVYSYASEYDVSVIEIFNKKGKHAEGDPLGVGFNFTKVIYQYDEEGYNYPIYYKLNGEEINYSDGY